MNILKEKTRILCPNRNRIKSSWHRSYLTSIFFWLLHLNRVWHEGPLLLLPKIGKPIAPVNQAQFTCLLPSPCVSWVSLIERPETRSLFGNLHSGALMGSAVCNTSKGVRRAELGGGESHCNSVMYHIRETTGLSSLKVVRNRGTNHLPWWGPLFFPINEHSKGSPKWCWFGIDSYKLVRVWEWRCQG